MTEILAAYVDEMRGLGNAPVLHVAIDTLPDKFVFEKKELREDAVGYVGWSDDGKGPFATHYTQTGNKTGSGSREIEVEMVDGSIETLKGPWIGSGIVEEVTGIPSMEVTMHRLPHDPTAVWGACVDEARRLKKFEAITDDTDDPQTLRNEVNRLTSLLWSESDRSRLVDRHMTIDRWERKYQDALWQTAASGRTRRAWSGTDKQFSCLAEYSLFSGRLAYAGCLSLDAAQKVLERLVPGWTVYPYAWGPSGAPSMPNPRCPYWQPAKKSSTGSIDGDDTPSPKEHGWWGYAVHDDHGYPLSSFFRTVGQLVDELAGAQTSVSLAQELASGHHRVSSFKKGQWQRIAPENERRLRRACAHRIQTA